MTSAASYMRAEHEHIVDRSRLQRSSRRCSGWAIGAGIKLNAPMIGKGDYFQTQVNYTEGATGYICYGGNARSPTSTAALAVATARA